MDCAVVLRVGIVLDDDVLVLAVIVVAIADAAEAGSRSSALDGTGDDRQPRLAHLDGTVELGKEEVALIFQVLGDHLVVTALVKLDAQDLVLAGGGTCISGSGSGMTTDADEGGDECEALNTHGSREMEM